MKKTTMSFVISVALVVLTVMSGAAVETFTPQGSTIVPTVMGRYTSVTSRVITQIHVTNITNDAVTCKITVFDHDGNDVTQYSKVYSGSNDPDNLVLLSSGTGTIELPANSARLLSFGIPSMPLNVIGHAVIEWSSADGKARKALMGTVYTYSQYGSVGSYSQYVINNGQPF